MTTEQLTVEVVRTPFDELTARSARTIVEWASERVALRFIDAVDLCIGHCATVHDVVQYAIDAVNDEAPEGHYYYLTADSNVLLDVTRKEVQ